MNFLISNYLVLFISLKISELFDNLTASLVYHKPIHPNKFCLNFLLGLRQAKSISSSTANPETLFKHCPVLFDDSNIEAVFNIIDPEGKGVYRRMLTYRLLAKLIQNRHDSTFQDTSLKNLLLCVF